MAETTIRELVNKHGLTLFALTHYERLGLIISIRGSRNRRCYTAKNVQRAKAIAELSGMGLPLSEIRDLLEDNATVPPDRIEAMVRRYTARRDALSSRLIKLNAYQGR